jgi:hypothetical protein
MPVPHLAAGAAMRETSTAGRAPTLCAIAFIGAAVVVAAVHLATPITRGWWLVAYLTLVGGLAQLLLFGGLVALARRSATRMPGAAVIKRRVVLWNAGTLIVAVMDLVELQIGVVVGAGALVVALVMFARDLRDVDLAAPALRDRWSAGYALLLIVLGCSVAIGVALAG